MIRGVLEDPEIRTVGPLETTDALGGPPSTPVVTNELLGGPPSTPVVAKVLLGGLPGTPTRPRAA